MPSTRRKLWNSKKANEMELGSDKTSKLKYSSCLKLFGAIHAAAQNHLCSREATNVSISWGDTFLGRGDYLNFETRSIAV